MKPRNAALVTAVVLSSVACFDPLGEHPFGVRTEPTRSIFSASGTVLDTEGHPVEGVEILISVHWSLFDEAAFGPFYTDERGQYSTRELRSRCERVGVSFSKDSHSHQTLPAVRGGGKKLE